MRAADDLEAFDELFQGRLRAMSDVHDLLHAQSYTGTSLREAVVSVLRPYGEDRVAVVDETGLEVGSEAAQGFALMIHELATNAAKYGALSARAGKVTILMQSEGADVLVTWREEGGPAVETPVHEGYGTIFVRATVNSLGGSVRSDYEADGLTVRLRLPADAISRGAA